MDDHIYINHFTDIPKEFHSFETGAPFHQCMVCEKKLLEAGTPYLIEKAVKHYKAFETSDVIFEYAICVECGADMRSQFSRDSLKKIEAYFSQHVDLMKRREQLIEEEKLEVKDWVSTCVIKGTPIEDATEYQMCAHCDGDKLMFSVMPYAISGQATDEIMQLLSAETLDEMDDMIDQYFGPPPEYRELFKRDLLLI